MTARLPARNADNREVRPPRLVAVLLASSVLLGACVDTRYEYVRDGASNAAFKVPSGWATFDKAAVLGLGSGPQPDTPDPVVWLVGIDGNPDPSVGNVLNSGDLTTEHPQGVAMVQDLSFTEHDSASFQYLRNFLLPVDQLIQNENSSAIVTYDDHVEKNGFRGIHLVMQFRESLLAAAGEEDDQTGGAESSDIQRALLGGQGIGVLSPDFVQVNQVALMDDATDRVYVMVIMCSAECYQRDRAEIEAVVDSWTVRA